MRSRSRVRLASDFNSFTRARRLGSRTVAIRMARSATSMAFSQRSDQPKIDWANARPVWGGSASSSGWAKAQASLGSICPHGRTPSMVCSPAGWMDSTRIWRVRGPKSAISSTPGITGGSVSLAAWRTTKVKNCIRKGSKMPKNGSRGLFSEPTTDGTTVAYCSERRRPFLSSGVPQAGKVFEDV